ncbi:MAG: DNA-3-methyladenine glycosylase [Bacteroidales bacterium]
MSTRIGRDFYLQDVLKVAPALIGKKLVLLKDGIPDYYYINETEAYRGNDDLACHASKGMTPRTEVMFREGGILYMYLIYGMYWMMNIVTSIENDPQAVLIRGLDRISGPGRLTKNLGLDRSFNGESLITSERIWLEEGYNSPKIITTPRIGIDYAGEPWVSKKWRFVSKPKTR